MKIHVFHGIYTASGSTSCPSLFPFLEAVGGMVSYPDYGWIAASESRRLNPVVAGTVRPYIEDGDVCVGHSNGCAIIYELVQSGLTPAGIVLIDAALRRDIRIPTGVKFVHVYFNRGDVATVIAQGLDEVPGLVDPNWGDMGHAGYSGIDPRVCNFNTGMPAAGEIMRPLPPVFGHGAVLASAPWEKFIADQIEGALA